MGQIKTQADWKYIIAAVTHAKYPDGEYSIVTTKDQMGLCSRTPKEDTKFFDTEQAAEDYMTTDIYPKFRETFTDFTVEPWMEQ